MKKIETAFSHLEYAKWALLPNSPVANPNHSKNLLITQSKPMKIGTFNELVQAVAVISNFNRDYTIFYRGVHFDYQFKNKNSTRSTLLPSIYWKKSIASQKSIGVSLDENFNILSQKTIALLSLIRNGYAGYKTFKNAINFQEILWSILQHYQVCGTPLLDMTHSLHVACSFAYHMNKNNSGIIYLIGMPYIHGPISYYVNEELVNLRLLNICPPIAQRPFIQEGYLAGHFPYNGLLKQKAQAKFDFSSRLIAKFEIPISETFWNQDFKPIPNEMLFPENDEMKELLKSLYKNV